MHAGIRSSNLLELVSLPPGRPKIILGHRADRNSIPTHRNRRQIASSRGSLLLDVLCPRRCPADFDGRAPQQSGGLIAHRKTFAPPGTPSASTPHAAPPSVAPPGAGPGAPAANPQIVCRP